MTATDATNSRLPIAVDAMGGDNAPDEIVLGALMAAREGIPVVLAGPAPVIEPILEAGNGTSLIEIADAPDVIPMNETSVRAFLRAKSSSIHVGMNLVKDNRAGAFVSAGNTPAVWTVSRRVLGMLPGVDRPALAAILPRLEGGYTIMLDVGANVDSSPHNLREFAVMGHYYSQAIMGIESPRVGLLSVGEESGKGNELTKSTFEVLGATGLNFGGNAEGSDVFSGRFDVVVTDGFTGNVVLKASEHLAESLMTAIRQELQSSVLGRIGGLLSKPSLRGLKKRVDYAEYGGAPLLGVNGGCLICHGRSDRRAIANAIKAANNFHQLRVNEKIRQMITELHTEERAGGLEDGSGEAGRK